MTGRSITRRAARRLSRLRRLRPGRETVDIPALVSPLRYDVIVRAQFLAELRDHHRGEPLTAVQEFALGHPYFVWFKHVESARFFPELLDDPDLLVERFWLRVARAVATLRSYEATGFDTRYPVTLAATPGGAVTASGTALAKTLHIRDGCHRLALLLIDGQDLQPAMYRVHPAARPVPDNTALLLAQMSIGDDEYARFLSPAFTSRECSSLPELESTVARESPQRLTELAETVRIHQQARLQAH